jgi:hypothetical protein
MGRWSRGICESGGGHRAAARPDGDRRHRASG